MFQNIDSTELEAMRKRQDITLIDVRTDAEVARGIIAGARHIPLFSLPQHASSLANEGTLVIYCQSGGRSAQACSYLAEQGFAELYNLSGGILGWVRDGKALSDWSVNS